MARATVRWTLTLGLTALVLGCSVSAMAPLSPATVGALGREAPAGRFVLATYNIENLFDGSNVVLDPKRSPAKPDAAKKALALSLHELNADVVGLVEVESRATLRHFRDQYVADMGYQHLALVEGNDPRGIDVAVMSRFPVTHIKSHRNTRIGVPGKGMGVFSRDVLEATIKPGKGYSFTVFMNHLKAIPGDPPSDAKRKAEAMKLREILRGFEKEHPNANYAVMGDLNDRPTSETLKVFFTGRDRDPALFDALGELGPQAYTYHPIQYRSRIDYILLSEGMRREYVSRSARIHESTASLAASDHLPASVTIDARRDQ